MLWATSSKHCLRGRRMHIFPSETASSPACFRIAWCGTCIAGISLYLRARLHLCLLHRGSSSHGVCLLSGGLSSAWVHVHSYLCDRTACMTRALYLVPQIGCSLCEMHIHHISWCTTHGRMSPKHGDPGTEVVHAGWENADGPHLVHITKHAACGRDCVHTSIR